MKAIIVREFGEPEVMKIEDVDLAAPTGKQVLVKIHAAGVNPVDTYLRTGIHAHAPKLPYTPGKDAAGVVEAVGEEVTRYKSGDRVYTAFSNSGTYAEYTLVDERDLAVLPENIGFEQGAGIWTPYATAYRALFQKCEARKGETVLIHGASGGVGIAATQWAKDRGLIVIGTAGSAAGIDLVKQEGADAVFDHTTPDYLSHITEFTEANGVPVIIEMLANVNLQKDFNVLAPRGRICVVGNRGSLDFNPRVIMGKDAIVIGMSLYNSTYEERAEIHAALQDGLARGVLRPIIAKRFPLADAPKAHHEVIEGKSAGKIVLIT